MSIHGIEQCHGSVCVFFPTVYTLKLPYISPYPGMYRSVQSDCLQICFHHMTTKGLLTCLYSCGVLQAESLVCELLELMEDILALGHVGVIIRTVELCSRLQIQQGPVTQAILSAFHCAGEKESKSVTALVTSLTTHDIFFARQAQPSGNGDKVGIASVQVFPCV